MAFQHGKDTFISLGAVDLSDFTTTSQIEQTADSHDVTTYGKDAHVKQGGLLDGTATMSGIYDNATTATPKLTIQPWVGQTKELIRKIPQAGGTVIVDTVDVVVKKYTETAPVADMISWSADFEMSDDLATTTAAS